MESSLVYAGHIPGFKQRFAVSDGMLSSALFALVVGALIGMPIAGHLSARIGSKLVARTSVIGYCLALILLSLAPAYWMFVASALIFGFVRGGVDVSINVQAVLVERFYDSPIMSSFQAFWSVGGLCGAGLASITLKNRLRPTQTLVIAAVGVAGGIPLALIAGHFMSLMLYELRSDDTLSQAAALVGIVGVSLAASFNPAQRASSIDPARALRSE